MAEEKTSKELLEAPDPFLVFVGKALDFVKKYQQQIMLGILVVVIAGVSVSGMIYYQRHTEEKASEMLAKAITQYQSLVKKDPNIINPKEPSADEYEKGLTAFKEIIDRYGTTGAGRAALLTYGDLCYRAKKYDEAVAAYEKALKAFSAGSSFHRVILNGLAYAYEAKQDFENASKYYQMIVDDARGVMKDQALFNLGRMYEKLGKTDQQMEVYKRIVAEYPDSMYFKLVKEKIGG